MALTMHSYTALVLGVAAFLLLVPTHAFNPSPGRSNNLPGTRVILKQPSPPSSLSRLSMGDDYLKTLEGSKSKTFVLKRAGKSKEPEEVTADSDGDKKKKPFSFWDKKEFKELPVVDTMEKTIVSVKDNSQNNAGDAVATFLKDFRGESKGQSDLGEAVANTNKKVDADGVLQNSEKSKGQSDDVEDKFSFAQRIESVKTGVTGLLAGGVAVTPMTFLHDYLFPDASITNGFAQFEFDTDTGSIDAALFAIVYRYCVREGEEKNEMLPMGVIGAFVVVRSLSRVRVSSYCSAAPLDCGAPLGYFDWPMIQQLLFSGLESVVLFGAAAAAMEYMYEKGYISKFK